MPFRWQGKYLLLTYPNSDFDLNGALHFIRSQGKPCFARICHELHDDGRPHRHAFVVYERRFSFTNERRFDYLDRHPNIAPRVDSPQGALDYVSKSGTYIDWGTLPDFAANDPPRESRNALWGRLLDEATSPSSFLQSVRENAPYDFATRYTQLETMANIVFKHRTPFESVHDAEDFTLPDTITGWMEKEFDPEVRSINCRAAPALGTAGPLPADPSSIELRYCSSD